MAHFQERRSGDDRRIFSGKDRRTKTERRVQTSEEVELSERARYKAWMTMRDKSLEE